MSEKYLIQRVAEYLVKHGEASTRELAAALQEETRRVLDAVKHPHLREKWGIERAGYDLTQQVRGHPPSIWRVDKAKYEKYLSTRRQMPWIADLMTEGKFKPGPKPGAKKVKTTKPKAASVKQPKADYSRKAPAYHGPHRTVWQPSSPYFRSNA